MRGELVKIKVTLVGGIEKVLTTINDETLETYGNSLDSVYAIARLNFKEAIIPYDKVLCIEEAVEDVY